MFGNATFTIVPSRTRPNRPCCPQERRHVHGTFDGMAKRSATAERQRLSRDAIVAGAVALADREGLDAVTIRRLAQDHGVTPMALYWHFREKDELLDGIAEHLFDQAELPDETDQPWPVRLRAVLEAFLGAIRQHPALAELTLPGFCPPSRGC